MIRKRIDYGSRRTRRMRRMQATKPPPGRESCRNFKQLTVRNILTTLKILTNDNNPPPTTVNPKRLPPFPNPFLKMF